MSTPPASAKSSCYEIFKALIRLQKRKPVESTFSETAGEYKPSYLPTKQNCSSAGDAFARSQFPLRIKQR